jgi:hypothetical protein
VKKPETGAHIRHPEPAEAVGSGERAEKHYSADTAAIPDTAGMPGTPAVSNIRENTAISLPGEQSSLAGIDGIPSGAVAPELISPEKPAFDADLYIISSNLENPGKRGPGSSLSPVIEVSAGSMKTWSSGEIAGGMGYMAGVGGNWQISRRLSIHGGGLLVYNRFSLQAPVSAKQYSGNDFYAAPGEFDPHPVRGIMEVRVLQYQNSTSDIEFTALDIPVNLRFNLRENPRNRIFLSAGFSSILYLQQKYRSESTVLASYSGINPQGHYESSTGYANLTTEGDITAFRRFDPAGLLNLSAGYEFRRRNHALIVEPYLKYPCFDITSLDLYIGMAGLSFKFIPDNR